MSSINRISQGLRAMFRQPDLSLRAPPSPQSTDPLGLQKDSFDASTAAAPVRTGGTSSTQSDAAAGLISQVIDLLKAIFAQLSGQPSASGQSPSVGATGATRLPSSGPQPNDPSTWNDNNAPYGVTLAGYSPQNHTDIKPSELGLTKNAKYAVYNYFLQNKTQPTKDWAPAAADALNKQYGTNIYHAIDGETLGYGDEYVHSAPNGYGMQKGTYNPNATGELFWGSTSS